jgi:hypothetical protein
MTDALQFLIIAPPDKANGDDQQGMEGRRGC